MHSTLTPRALAFLFVLIALLPAATWAQQIPGFKLSRQLRIEIDGSKYRFLGEVVGGVFMGAGAGWLADRFITPEPLGLVLGLFLGAGLSIFVAVRTAARTQRQAAAKAGPLPSVPDDDED